MNFAIHNYQTQTCFYSVFLNVRTMCWSAKFCIFKIKAKLYIWSTTTFRVYHIFVSLSVYVLSLYFSSNSVLASQSFHTYVCWFLNFVSQCQQDANLRYCRLQRHESLQCYRFINVNTIYYILHEENMVRISYHFFLICHKYKINRLTI
jgi:hypothetical protein